MATYVQLARPRRRRPAARHVPRAATLRSDTPRLTDFDPGPSPLLFPVSRSTEPGPGPHLDYARRLTPEGGILITYKDLDLRLRHIIARILIFAAFTGLEAWLLLDYSPLQSEWINYACLLAMAGINFLILWRLPEIYRSIEIRPDCMILDHSEIFWLGLMESVPTFKADEKDNGVLSGIYGTRNVEYLKARRFDKHDRMPDVFAAHLKEAMRQLWEVPSLQEPKHSNSPPWQQG
jgi:hypothetical protein